jgi:hypothetical protein
MNQKQKDDAFRNWLSAPKDEIPPGSDSPEGHSRRFTFGAGFDAGWHARDEQVRQIVLTAKRLMTSAECDRFNSELALIRQVDGEPLWIN